jgi:DNA-binding transcriptional regulator YhcF (GntR family)
VNDVPAYAAQWQIAGGTMVPAFDQIRVWIADGAASGSLPVGTRLPAVRALAAHLNLAVNTVAKAYRELEQAGIVETRGRHGTIIAAAGDERLNAVGQAASAFAAVVRQYGMADKDALNIVQAALVRDGGLGR